VRASRIPTLEEPNFINHTTEHAKMESEKFNVLINVHGKNYYGTMNADLFEGEKSIYFAGTAIEISTDYDLHDEIKGMLAKPPIRVEDL